MKAAAALLFAVLLFSCSPKRTGPAPDPDVRKLPLIDLPAVGPERYAPSMLQDRVVLIHFTATWCFPCLSELPSLETLQKRHGERGLQVIAIGLDLEGRTVLEPFAYHYRMPFPILVADDRFRNGETRFGRIISLPAYALYGRDGVAIAAWQGPAPFDKLEDAVLSALK